MTEPNERERALRRARMLWEGSLTATLAEVAAEVGVPLRSLSRAKAAQAWTRSSAAPVAPPSAAVEGTSELGDHAQVLAKMRELVNSPGRVSGRDLVIVGEYLANFEASERERRRTELGAELDWSRVPEDVLEVASHAFDLAAGRSRGTPPLLRLHEALQARIVELEFQIAAAVNPA